ncbi:MAG: glycosyltransferase family 4 protein [Hyphomicrobiaceae bacterium]
MRIAQIAPLYEAVPPALYGGTERIVAYLSDALVELGHDVTLFASADSRTAAHLIAVREKAIRLDGCALKSDLAAHLSMLHEVRRRADEFDVLHFHTDLLHFPLFEDHAAHTLTTVHGRLDIKDLEEVYHRWPQYPLVSISDAQRTPLRQANWLATVPHGLPDNLLQYSPKPGRYLAFLGRIAPEKRPDRAVRIAQTAGMPLRIAAKIDALDRAYFEAEIEPLLSTPGVQFIGEINEQQKATFLANAAALLLPIDWPEPFGLVIIEAMACGTPVIAWAHGSVPELIDHGQTGFIVSSETEAASAVARLAEIDRHQVRRTFEQRFGATTMARNYRELYGCLANRGARSQSLRPFALLSANGANAANASKA